MTLTFSVRRAIVTGGAHGIGCAIAFRLAREGFSVAILDRDGGRASDVAREIMGATGTDVLAFACDLIDRGSIEPAVNAAVQELGGLDTLVTNAGVARDAFAHKLTDEAWDEVLAVHLTGTFACVRAGAPFLRADGPGRIITVSSISAAMGNLGQANYTAAKGGIVSLTKTLALEFARTGTTVNCIRPGFIDTDMTRNMPVDARERLVATIPLQRAGLPEDIAGAVAFLCSDDASFITGATLDINGGSYM